MARQAEHEAGSAGAWDVFGFDPELRRRASRWMDAMNRRVFRTRVLVDMAPDTGRPVLFIANHGGFLPVDAMVLMSVLEPLAGGRPLRPLLEDYVFTLPWVGLGMSRLGCVRASQENAVRLMEGGASILAFPEGVKGAGKTVFQAGQVLRFGRGGLVRLALRTGTPIVPVGISGAEAAYPVLARLDKAGRMAGLPFVPVTPTFPALGPLGLLPLPARFTVVVGDTLDLREAAGAGEPDESRVLRVNELVRGRVAELVARARQQRA